MRPSHHAAISLALWILALTSSLRAQESFVPRPILPLDGSLVLAGDGKLHDAAAGMFVHLGGGFTADVVVVATEGKALSLKRWTKAGARSVFALGREPLPAETLAPALLAADAVWFEDAAESLQSDALFHALLRNVLARGGVVGGQGEGALALCDTIGSEGPQGFGLLRRSRVRLVSKSHRSKRGAESASADGQIVWQLPRETALVISHSRRVSAVGKHTIAVSVAGGESWPERLATLSPVDVYDYGDVPQYDLDLLSWQRSAQDRQGPAFPPVTVDAPSVSRGTLFLSGGGGVQSPTWERFIKAAGGKKAKFVTIPSAGSIGAGSEPKSYGAGQLRDHGCRNVVVLHTSDALRADDDPELLALLEDATGVWIDGGRTFRFMDAFQFTRAHELIRGTLERGGAVGGSSAGCQVLGDFLVRGDPRTNQTLAFEGYTKGLGLLPGVVLDAHFLQRERHGPFSELVARHPQLLGIGVDADTTLIVHKSVAEVLGNECVSFYNANAPDTSPVILKKGQRYDLSKRRALR